jgi:predicted permease
MLQILEVILEYIKGLWTLPWILIGFIVTIILSRFFSEQKINNVMKKIGLILLYFFVPLLLFRIFLGVDFRENEIIFTAICFVVLTFMYVIAYFFALFKIKKTHLTEKTRRDFIKTVLTNQGRSSAFIGGAMLAIQEWRVPAAIYMSIGAIFLFAFIPYFLSYLHKKDIKNSDKNLKHHVLPWYLRFFPWYLLSFAFVAIAIHGFAGITPKSFGNDIGIIFEFITQLTIPAALYYVGSGIHPSDLKLSELKKLFGFDKSEKEFNHWSWVRNIFIVTVLITPLLTAFIFGPLFLFGIITISWFAVITINSILPITSTNMFLIPYGIDKKSTAHAVTWTTIVCVPIVVLLITVFRVYLI